MIDSITSPPRERLFALQLRLKKDTVNKQRKLAETFRLQNSCEEQIRAYLATLYRSSVYIWSILHSTPSELISTPVPLKQIISTAEAPPEIAAAIAAPILAPPASLADFLRLLFVHSYLWSRESLDGFAGFLASQDRALIPILSEAFFIHPLTQIYFQTALRPIFEKLETGADFVETIKASLVQTAPLMPAFLRRLISEFPQKHIFFFDSFLKCFLTHYALFGIAGPELRLFLADRYVSLLDSLGDFFHSDAAASIVDLIIACPKQMTNVPSESMLSAVCPRYVSQTLVDSKDSDQLFYVTLSNRWAPSEQPPAAFTTDSLPTVIRRFLIAADLIKVEQDYSSPFEYFLQISNLSSVWGDPLIEVELDKLHRLISSHPCLQINTVLQIVEDLLAREAETAIEDPLRAVSGYSSQAAYIQQLSFLVDQISVNAKVYINFLKLEALVAQAFSQAPTEPFVEAFANACQLMTTIIPQPDFLCCRSLFSLIAKTVGLELLPNDRDAELQAFLRTHSATIIEAQQQPFLQIYRDNPERLDLFAAEFACAFTTQMPFVRIGRIHCAYQILNGLLEMQGMREIGADQLVPFAILGTVYANPLGLASTSAFFADYVEPLSECGSPLDHHQEYSVIQFISTCQFIFERMAEIDAPVS
jgi:hypothetical protein